MADVSKHLDRAKKFLEKNRIEDAIEAYLSVLEEAPSHPEATQALGDLYARREQPETKRREVGVRGAVVEIRRVVQVGFEDEFLFSRRFKSFFGVPPREFRRSGDLPSASSEALPPAARQPATRPEQLC